MTPPVTKANEPRVAGALACQPRTYEVAKRLLDMVVAGAALVLLLPALLVISMLIRVNSEGGAIFRQARVGRDQQPFTLLKFRSMRVGSDERLHRAYIDHLMTSAAPQEREDGLYKLTRDPRVTPVGALLRRTSLDELPQLLNVLRGQMSLVGPRPALAFEVAYYDPQHHLRFAVKPGLTGLWQVSGRNALTMRQALDLDVKYVRHRSFLFDLRILLRTIPTVLGRKAR